jgi:FtsP/CotA-like multicopper oxidase with cupredoxin domain
VKRVGAVCALLSLAGCNVGAGGSALPLAPADTPAIVSSHGVATFELRAEMDPMNGFPTLVYQGDYGYAPTLYVHPGDTIVGDISDDLPPAGGLASDVNLHFHGLNVSPRKPSDDVLTMLAKPGGSLHYVVKIPPSQPPGLYWYHTHVHGETNYQVGQGGMSGAIVVEGLSPAGVSSPEQVLIVRQLGTGAGSLQSTMRDDNDMTMSTPSPRPPNAAPCEHTNGDLLTVNRLDRPTLHVAANRPAFIGVLNATGHRTLDLSIGGAPMRVVALDGYPLHQYPGEPSGIWVRHLVLPPAGRVEFVTTIAAASELQTSCYFSGPGGDADPPQLLARLRPDGGEASRSAAPAVATVHAQPQSLPPPAASRIVRLSEDAHGFYINGQAFSPHAKPMFVVHVGTVERWTVLNLTPEVHAFHTHQVHFVVESTNGAPEIHHFWRDTVVVPYGHREADGSFKPGELTLVADFRNPVIRGTFLFHCHILDHEDHGMMAKIEAVP